MTRPQDRHLDSDELDALVTSQDPCVSIAGTLSEEAAREAQRHVQSCRYCDRKVQMHRSAQTAISLRAASGRATKGANCSDETTWVSVAAGLLEEAEAKERMNHAAQCGHCGPLLRAAARNLSDETTPDEKAALANLSSTRPDWKRQMARTLRCAAELQRPLEAAPSFWKGLFYWPRPEFAVGALVLVIAVSWIGVRLLSQASAEQLLAQAYTEHRTIEVRIPGAQYAPIRVERSAGRSSFDKPQSLLKAEALISENLRLNPNDPKWLEAQARAELLDGSYEDAIKILQRALESKPDSPELLTDLGSAYYLRAETADRPIDFGKAIESLDKALDKNPDDPIALFNRALACEQMFLYTQAIDDWKHYLRIDPHSEWADEARTRLHAIQEKVNVHSQSMAEPLLTPAQIVEAVNDTNLESKLDARIEEYLHRAIVEWLPKAVPMAGLSSHDSIVALSVLSTIMIERHNDSWLADLLIQPKRAPFAGGIQSLAEAISEDDAGSYSEGREAAERAARMLDASGNRAAEIRAIAEQIYADHLSWESTECISLLRRLSVPLQNSRYWWLRAQMSLEHSNCANQTGDMGTYLSAINEGVQQAKDHRYTPLYLRGLGFEALAVASLGDVAKGFSLAVGGLGLFWSNDVEVMKGYNFYSHLDAMANQIGLSHFEVLACLEGTVLLDNGPNLLRRAMAHSFAGKAAYLANNPNVAVAEFSKARDLFSEVPQTPATTRDRLEVEAWVANAEISSGDLRRATDLLEAIEPALFGAQSLDPEIEYYRAMANLGMRKSTSDLEPILRSALFLAEWSLKTFPDEQGRRSWTEQSQDAYRDAVEWKFRQGDATSSLELWEWFKGAEIRAAERSVAEQTGSEAGTPPDPRNAPLIPTPTAVAGMLPSLDDQTVLAFATFYDGVAVWVYDDRGIFTTWVSAPPNKIRELAIGLREFCADSKSNLADLRATAHSLYSLLLQPIEKHLVPSRTLVLEPDDGYLAAIPWEVLLDSDGHYLAQRYATVISPGAYWQIRRGAPTTIAASTPALVVSVPTSPAEELVPLSEADHEGQLVAGMFPHSLWLRGSAATVSTIREDIRGKGIFHFVGHAIASPQRSGLVLAEVDPAINRAQLLTAQSLRHSEINSMQLAVLSACPTDFEDRVLETAEDALPGTFLRAGVPHVVASRWNVDSSQTSVFMTEFYKRLLTGAGVPESVRSARLALASQPTSAHPYYWSAFELAGVQ